MKIKSFLLVTIASLAGCSGVSTPSRTINKNSNAVTQTTDVGVNAATLEQLRNRDSIELQELASLKEVNQILCARLQQLRQECAASYRIAPSAEGQELACTTGNKTVSTSDVAFEVDFQGDGRSYLIQIDNNWDSNAFSNGVTKLSWKARLSTSTQAPKIIDSNYIALYPNDISPVPDVSAISKFDVKANGIIIMTKQDLVNAQQSKGYMVVNLERILAAKNSDKCKVSQEEIIKLTSAINQPNPTVAQ